MAQFTTPEKAAFHLARDRSEQPRGVGLSALALLALLVGNLLGELLELYRTLSSAPSASPGTTGFELLQIGSLFGIGALCIWHYRQGRSWARLLVLLWSFASVARALSFLAEHNLDPAALMARPLRFFQAVLGAVLLYWLNTSKVRAWYRKSSVRAGDLIADQLHGRLCTGVELDSNAGIWRLHFEHDAGLILRCPWRIVLDDNLAFASAPGDDAPSLTHTGRSAFARAAEQQPPETVPAPGHLPQEARRLLGNLRVTAVRLAPRSSDLFVSFEMGIELQTWSSSESTEDGSAANVGQALGAGVPGVPEAGSAALPRSAPLWEYSDPALTVIASEAGVNAQMAAVPTEAED